MLSADKNVATFYRDSSGKKTPKNETGDDNKAVKSLRRPAGMWNPCRIPVIWKVSASEMEQSLHEWQDYSLNLLD